MRASAQEQRSDDFRDIRIWISKPDDGCAECADDANQRSPEAYFEIDPCERIAQPLESLPRAKDQKCRTACGSNDRLRGRSIRLDQVGERDSCDGGKKNKP